MELIRKAGFNPHEYISFFNLRSFDRIPLTQQIINQEHASGIDTVKADIALGLDLNGLDSYGKQDVGVSSCPTGDAMDSITYDLPHLQANRKQATTTNGLGEMFDWSDETEPETKQQKVTEVLTKFENAMEPPPAAGKVSGTVSQHGMMTGTNVFDEAWIGEKQEAVKNFVSEELYIHTKVTPHYERYTNYSL